MNHYKVLTHSEICYYKKLSEKQLVKELTNLNKVNIINKSSDIELDEKFYVINGNYDAVLSKDERDYFLSMKEIDSLKYTNKIIVNINATNYLEIKYYKDIYYYEDVARILRNKQFKHLYNADVNCEHEIVGGYNYSGVRCEKCNGWYCS